MYFSRHLNTRGEEITPRKACQGVNWRLSHVRYLASTTGSNANLPQPCCWVLARQLDADAGSLVTDNIRNLGLELMPRKRVAATNIDCNNSVKGIVFEDNTYRSCVVLP